MTRLVLILALFVLLFPSAARAELDVVVTTPNLAALAQAVGGEHVGVTSLSLPTQDPHYVDPKPSLVLKVNRADALLAVGAGLEAGWLPTLQTGARNPAILRGGKGFLDCSEKVALKEVASGQVDRGMGDIHPDGNPHFLRSPKEGLRCANAVAELFAELDPKNRSSYEANLKALRSALEKRIPKWEARIRKFGNLKVIPYHNSWVYFTDWLGIETDLHVEPKPGVAPSPAHIAKLIRTIQSEKIPLIIEEEYHPTRGPSLIADRTSAELLVLPGGARVEKGQSYVEYVEEMIRKIETALDGAKQ